MNSTSRLLLCLILLSAACGCVSAEDTTPVVPDERLAQKVTYEARYRPVQHILEDLSSTTGVRLVGGYNSSDWQVYSRRMNIFVKDIPLSGLMNSMARVMKFRWTRKDNVHPPVYRLTVDPKALAYANYAKARGDNEKEARWSGRRQEWLEIIRERGNMSPADIDAVRHADPELYRHAKPGALAALRTLFDEVPEAKDAFAAGQSFRIAADKLTPETRRLLFSTGDEFAKFLQRYRVPEPTGLKGMLKEDESFDIAYCRLDVGSFTPNLRWSIYTQGSTGYFHFSKGEHDWQIVSLGDRGTDWSRAMCERENKIIDGTADRKTSYQELATHIPKLMTDREKEEEDLYPSEPLTEHEDAPEVQNKVKMKIEQPKPEEKDQPGMDNRIAAFQKALSEATGMAVVSDSWANVGEDEPDASEAELRQMLDKFAKQFNYNWDRSPAGVLEFRHRKWWKKRLDQVPEQWVTRWRENTIKNKLLSLNDLAEISNLDYEQAEESVKSDKVLGGDGLYGKILPILDANGNLHCLRLYSQLSAKQRALLAAPTGLNGGMLTERQWELARPIFDRIGTDRGEAVFLLERLPDPNQAAYKFTEFDAESGQVDRTWVVRLPVYTPPPSQAGRK